VKGGEWFVLHRRKGCEVALILLSTNPMFILGMEVQIFCKDAASIPASDSGGAEFFCEP
jgi:hypothetical protein